jgi:hypothetical protein
VFTGVGSEYQVSQGFEEHSKQGVPKCRFLDS